MKPPKVQQRPAKGPKLDSTTKTRQELELPLPDGQEIQDEFLRLFEGLGFRHVATVRKHRHPGRLNWQNQAVQVAIDDVEHLGAYLELEIAADDATLGEARQALKSLASELDLGSGERRSYLELLLVKSS